MFSTKNGLYERARRQFKIQDGIRLFSYSFYKQRRADVQAFFAQIYSEAQVRDTAAAPAACHGSLATRNMHADLVAHHHTSTQASQAARGHHALAQLHQLGRLQRHYTLNIDGLAEVVGMDSWHHEFNPEGITVEMHGNIRWVGHMWRCTATSSSMRWLHGWGIPAQIACPGAGNETPGCTQRPCDAAVALHDCC